MLVTFAAVWLTTLPAPQDPPRPAPPDRMSNYPRPSAEDLKKPPLIRWQRTWEDAEAVAKATQRPLLVVMNMDGEPACETFAGIKYRDPEFAKKAAPYVAFVASIQRHNARDHDEQGRRIPCPRLGCVTCGEHIAAEKVLFEKYFKDNPVAPRHIAVGTDGKVLFDRFLDTDLRRVDDALARHAPSGWQPGAPHPRDGAARDALEAAYLAADAGGRRAALLRAGAATDEPFDLLRLGLHDLDPNLRALAVEALAKTATVRALPLLTHAQSLDLDEAQRGVLLAALERLGKDDVEARNVVKIQRALATPSRLIDAGKWLAAARATRLEAADPEDLAALETKLDELDRELKKKPDDGALRLQHARTLLRFALARGTDTKEAGMHFEDVRRAAAKAKERGAPAHAADAIAARAAWWLSEPQAAAELATAAVPGFAAEAGTPDAVDALWCFAQARVSALWLAIREQKDWPADWVADAHAAFQVLADHPLGTAEHAAMQVDFLNNLSATREAGRALQKALARFPNAPPLHEHFRNQVLHRSGPQALEAAYEALRVANPDPAQFEWFHGYAALVVAEVQMRARDPQGARAAYRRALARFDKCAAGNEQYRDSADHYAALASAGEARVALEADDLEGAVDAIVAALRRRPASAGSEDGMQRTPAQTLQFVRAAVQRADAPDLAEKLETRVKEIDPALWPAR